MRSRSIALLLLLAGCDDRILVVLSTAQSGPEVLEPSDEEQAILDEAFAFWARDFVLVESDPTWGTRGKLVIMLARFDDASQFGGFTDGGGGCHPGIVSHYDAMGLAHEIGHAFGLRHTKRENNLMNRDRGAWDVNARQWDEAQDGIDRFLVCAGGGS